MNPTINGFDKMDPCIRALRHCKECLPNLVTTGTETNSSIATGPPGQAMTEILLDRQERWPIAMKFMWIRPGSIAVLLGSEKTLSHCFNF